MTERVEEWTVERIKPYYAKPYHPDDGVFVSAIYEDQIRVLLTALARAERERDEARGIADALYAREREQRAEVERLKERKLHFEDLAAERTRLLDTAEAALARVRAAYTKWQRGTWEVPQLIAELRAALEGRG